ncbi:MAG: hypothetical protein HYX50_04480 [Chloroflexi bacterium]|nr:hypothetical protein [Chloroflexota bacterium]
MRRIGDVRIEVVTASFVASGRPQGIHDLGRLLENLNNPALSSQLELGNAAVRPLYRAQAQVELDAPLLVRRDEMIFANFEGPYFLRGAVRPTTVDVTALLLAPPFQIQATVQVTPGADVTQSIRTMSAGFFVARNALVFDAEGHALGEGEQIVVSGRAVQMACATERRIAAVQAPPAAAREQRAEFFGSEEPERTERAA